MATPLLDKLFIELINHAYINGFRETLVNMIEAVTKVVVICQVETGAIKFNDKEFKKHVEKVTHETAQRYTDIVASDFKSDKTSVEKGGFIHMKANAIQMFKQVIADLEKEAVNVEST